MLIENEQVTEEAALRSALAEIADADKAVHDLEERQAILEIARTAETADQASTQGANEAKAVLNAVAKENQAIKEAEEQVAAILKERIAEHSL